jgi:hypothetical protein
LTAAAIQTSAVAASMITAAANAAKTVVLPRSEESSVQCTASLRALVGCHGMTAQGAERERGALRGHGGRHKPRRPLDIYSGAGRRDPRSGLECALVVPTCGQPRRFAGRVKAPHLRAYSSQAADAAHDDRYQRRERDSRLDR